MDSRSRVIMCGGIPTKRDLEIVAEFREFLRTRKEEMPDNPSTGTDVGAPDLNAEWADELDTEEYRDPIGKDGSDD